MTETLTIAIMIMALVVGSAIGSVIAIYCSMWAWGLHRCRKTLPAAPDAPAPPAMRPPKGYKVKVIGPLSGATDKWSPAEYLRHAPKETLETLMGCITDPKESDAFRGLLNSYLEDPDVQEILIRNREDVRITYSSGRTMWTGEAFCGPEHYSDILLRCLEENGHFIGKFRVWVFVTPVFDKNKRVANKNNGTIICMKKAVESVSNRDESRDSKGERP
jgi:hypothetical protein